jgi:hypothetical protein
LQGALLQLAAYVDASAATATVQLSNSVQNRIGAIGFELEVSDDPRSD